MKPITGRSGEVLAYEHDASPYRREIRDRAGGLLGTYNPQTGKTHDRSGRVVSSSGDIRTSLIPKDDE